MEAQLKKNPCVYILLVRIFCLDVGNQINPWGLAIALCLTTQWSFLENCPMLFLLLFFKAPITNVFLISFLKIYISHYFFNLANNFWIFSEISNLSHGKVMSLLEWFCAEMLCVLDLTCLITISFSPLLRDKERLCYSASSPLKTSVQHFLPELIQHSKTFTPSEEVHNIPSETGLFCGLWITEKCLSLTPVGIRMLNMLHYRFISTNS